MSKANLALTENFYFNNMLARALVQVAPYHERVVLLKWFDRLNELKKDQNELEIRKDYMIFILLMLQCNKVREPFTDPPPSIIIPLKDAVNKKIYEEILLSNDAILTSENTPIDENENEEDNDDDQKVKNKYCAPPKFFSEQPYPNDGVIVYTAVFSSQEKC
ncbi:unnamed protein product [Brassicogethes aeneus]|uniref:DUF4485 domain-containing protein n=1 Tax=Brassicogethes aeneus TaxID=1431903 RepID=A0A9P0B4N2_BRAAE|nr:unnamed protein product [Brassicogethes aeneus]